MSTIDLKSLSYEQLAFLANSSTGVTGELVRAELAVRDESNASAFKTFAKSAFLPVWSAAAKCLLHHWLRPDNGYTECAKCGESRPVYGDE